MNLINDEVAVRGAMSSMRSISDRSLRFQIINFKIVELGLNLILGARAAAAGQNKSYYMAPDRWTFG